MSTSASASTRREAVAVAPGAPRRAGVRPEIQALRALAVALVMAYHLFPGRLAGGYVGVDVFFVVSGFLITAHLTREYVSNGTVHLGRFWARRIRRLLPASVLVLAFALVAAMFVAPENLLRQNVREIIASSFSVQNWLLASDSVDYLAAANTPSMVQHYWSLSVEEQLYIVWPLLIVAVATLSRAEVRGARHVRASRGPGSTTGILVALVAVVVVSLSLSYAATRTGATSGYFLTYTRAWEFAAGGVVGVLSVRSPGRFRQLVGTLPRWGHEAWVVAGVLVIVASAVVLDSSTPYPGVAAALPVAGTLLVLVLGLPPRGGPIGRVIEARPVQVAGDLSYGLYLWHWPLIVLFPLVVGRPHGLGGALVLVVVSVVAASVSRRWVEDPLRTPRPRTAPRTWPTYALAGAATAVMLAVGVAALTVQDRRDDEYSAAQAEQAALAERASAEGTTSCYGAAAMLAGARCVEPFAVPDALNLGFVVGDREPSWCMAEPTEAMRSCTYGTVEDPVRTIALVGDSHGVVYISALEKYAVEHDWQIVTYLRTGCPALSTEPIELPGRPLAEQESCAGWSAEVLETLEASQEIDTVVFAAFAERYADPAVAPSGRLDPATVEHTWTRVLDSGKGVVVLRDVPDTDRTDIPSCVAAAGGADDPCSRARRAAVTDDVVMEASRAMEDRVAVVDLTDMFCDETTCHAVIGGIVVYFDDNHLSASYVMTLASTLGDRIGEVLRPTVP